MGAREKGTKPAKPSNQNFSAQGIPTDIYPGWPSPMQAFYGPSAVPAPYFPSIVAPPSHHPYIWGSQHPLMTPYGTSVPYPVLYPPGGVSVHPNMTMTPNPLEPNAKLKGKGPLGKDQASNIVGSSDNAMECATIASCDANGLLMADNATECATVASCAVEGTSMPDDDNHDQQISNNDD